MEIHFAGSIPKAGMAQESNEDCTRFVEGPFGVRVAVSDGASESFASMKWAELLCNEFLEHGSDIASWVSKAQLTYAASFKLAEMSWSQEAAYERGSFATLLGLEFNQQERALTVLSIGDTQAVLFSSGCPPTFYPYQRSEEFSSSPTLVSTKTEHNSFLQKSELSALWPIPDDSEGFVFCMTDALAQWAMHEHENGDAVWDRLGKVECESDFYTLVESARKQKSMRNDDTTLITLKFKSAR